MILAVRFLDMECRSNVETIKPMNQPTNQIKSKQSKSTTVLFLSLISSQDPCGHAISGSPMASKLGYSFESWPTRVGAFQAQHWRNDLGGCFKYLLFSPLFGEHSHYD